MQEQIFKDLEIIGHKFSKIEEELGMPKNYLSRFKNPENILPKKWVEPLQKYIEANLERPDLFIPNTENTPDPVFPYGEIQKLDATKKMMVVSPIGLEEKSVKAVATEAMEKINKDFGKGTVMFFGSKPDTGYKVISTGSLGLDIALGIGGLPMGRMVEIYGWESSGKTTIALNVIANAQKKGLKCLLIDAESSFDPEYATALGVDITKLKYCQPSYGEQGLEVADRQMVSGEADVVVIDSVAALVPKAELEGEHGDSKMGLHARLMSQACRKMTSTIGNSNSLVIFINQLRHKIGVMPNMNPEVTTGGNALKFYTSVRLEVRRSTTIANSIVNNNVIEGNQTTVKVVKNKCSPPFTKAIFNILYGEGIDRMGEVVDIATELGIIQKAASWYSYNANKLGQGRDAVIQLLKDNPEMATEIENKIKTHTL